MGRVSLFVLLAFVLLIAYGSLVSGAEAKNEESQLESTDSGLKRASKILFRKIPMIRKTRNLNLNNYRRGEYQQQQPLEVEFMDDVVSDFDKRFDDYGHMRFGKRGNEDSFDDYGHMRFGK